MIFYQGPSVLDGNPIVGVLTGYNKKGSANAKTGAMLQTWILRSDIHPAVAAKDGSDYSICGNCVHRKSADRSRSCYVRVEQAPAAVWKAFKRNSYATISPYALGFHLSGKSVRLGSYGDPVAIPGDVWLSLTARVASHTGYTHQWKLPEAQWAKRMLQASCDTEADYNQAKQLDWRTFYVYNPKGTLPTLLDKLGVCPSSKEWKLSGKPNVPCASCLKCNGSKADIKIQGHGRGSKRIGLALV